MASGSPKKSENGGSGGSLLAPSKFSSDFSQTEPKTLFTGLKASKLAGVSQGLGQGATVPSRLPTLWKPTRKNEESPCNPSAVVSETSQAKSPSLLKSASSTGDSMNVNCGRNDAAFEEPEKKDTEDSAAPSFVFGSNLGLRATHINADGAVKEKDTEGAKETFVFGQNLSERAANFASGNDEHERSAAESLRGAESNVSKSSCNDPSSTGSEKSPSGTLTENAAAYFGNKAAQKRKYDEVEVTTGEENEYNVLQTSAKLYLFDHSNWVEKGRGQLRLNDLPEEPEAASGSSDGANNTVSYSRLVMRTMGSLKVILNTKVFNGMTVEQPNEKSVRLTGMDELGDVKIFLVVCAPKDAWALHKALKSRLERLKTTQSAQARPNCEMSGPEDPVSEIKKFKASDKEVCNNEEQNLS